MRKINFLILTIFCLFQFNNLNAQDHVFHKVAEGLKFPEGPAYDGNNTVYVSNCHGDFITKIVSNKQDVFITVGEDVPHFKQTNGMTYHKDGFLYACEYGYGRILKFTPEGEEFIVADGYKGEHFNRPNDLAFNSKGDIYFSDPKSYGADKPDGRLFRINAENNEVELLYDGLCFPNGIAVHPDEKELYLCESAKNRILKFQFKDDGTVGEPTEFVVLPGGDPDGIAFDVEHNLWVAHFGTGTIFVISPDGKVLKEIKAPGKKPSNVEFAGKDMKTLYITEDETNCVYYTEVEVPGFVLFNQQ